MFDPLLRGGANRGLKHVQGKATCRNTSTKVVAIVCPRPGLNHEHIHPQQQQQQQQPPHLMPITTPPAFLGTAAAARAGGAGAGI
jgi:hypothetical protein